MKFTKPTKISESFKVKTWFDFFRLYYCDVQSKFIFVSDCDGILTNGKNIYTKDGKIAKEYGAYDKEAIQFITDYMMNKIYFVTNDSNGMNIHMKRINDIKKGLNCSHLINIKEASPEYRLQFIKELKQKNDGYKIVFIGDSYSDIPSLVEADFALTVNNAPDEVKYYCNYVSKKDGGNGGFEDCIFEFYKNIHNINLNEK